MTRFLAPAMFFELVHMLHNVWKLLQGTIIRLQSWGASTHAWTSEDNERLIDIRESKLQIRALRRNSIPNSRLAGFSGGLSERWINSKARIEGNWLSAAIISNFSYAF